VAVDEHGVELPVGVGAEHREPRLNSKRLPEPTSGSEVETPSVARSDIMGGPDELRAPLQ
jgi:hypothetical protein